MDDIFSKKISYIIYVLVLHETRKCPLTVITDLKDNENELIRTSIALNSVTPINILKDYVSDKSNTVKLALTRNKKTTKEIFELLQKSEDLVVSLSSEARYELKFNGGER